MNEVLCEVGRIGRHGQLEVRYTSYLGQCDVEGGVPESEYVAPLDPADEQPAEDLEGILVFTTGI